MERPARDKHSSLLGPLANCKKHTVLIRDPIFKGKNGCIRVGKTSLDGVKNRLI
jgi:hypothetical protein